MWSLIKNFFGSLIYVFVWVPKILMGLMFVHHRKFGVFFEMEVIFYRRHC